MVVEEDELGEGVGDELLEELVDEPEEIDVTIEKGQLGDLGCGLFLTL